MFQIQELDLDPVCHMKLISGLGGGL